MKMMTGARAGVCLLVVSVLGSCASSASVDLTEPRRVLGRENDVRLDAQIFNERLAPNTTVRIVLDVTNERPEPIAIADIVSYTTFDPETTTLTVHVGSEVPGNRLLPRLIEIAPGQKHSQSFAAPIPPIREATGGRPIVPRQLRIKLNYLENTGPFQELVGISERAVADSTRADELFDQWVEASRTIDTNTLPIEWGGPGGFDNMEAGRRRL